MQKLLFDTSIDSLSHDYFIHARHTDLALSEDMSSDWLLKIRRCR